MSKQQRGGRGRGRGRGSRRLQQSKQEGFAKLVVTDLKSQILGEITTDLKSQILGKIITQNDKVELLNPRGSGNTVGDEKFPHYVSNFKGFTVRIRLNRRGEQKLSSVSMVGRVPTRYYRSGQGPHIVANGLCLLALESLLEFKEFDQAIENLISFVNKIPNINEKTSFERKTWQVDGQVYDTGNVTFNRDKIINDLKVLKERTSSANRGRAALNTSSLSNVGNLKAARQYQSLLRTDLAFITSNVVRLWNQRKGTVWDERETDPSYFEKEAFATTFKGGANERNALEYLRGLKAKPENYVKEDLIQNVVLLIDIRPKKAVEMAKLGTYDNYSIAAITEAIRLIKFILPDRARTMPTPPEIEKKIEEREWRGKVEDPPAKDATSDVEFSTS